MCIRDRLATGVTVDAQIEVVAGCASDKLALRQHNNTAVARTGWDLRLLREGLCLVCKRSGHLLLVLAGTLHQVFDLDGLARASGTWRDALSSAVDDFAILDRTLDEPVTLTRAKLARYDAILAQIVVAAVADTAMEMCVRHSLIACLLYTSDAADE